jgi:hypothetical protein
MFSIVFILWFIFFQSARRNVGAFDHVVRVWVGGFCLENMLRHDVS